MIDLLDALHYMFEEDMVPMNAEQQEAREKMRVNLYSEIYERGSYKWITQKSGGGESASGTTYGGDFDSASEPVDGKVKLESKEYIPPTPFNPDAAKPFGDILDEPMG